MPKKDLKGKKFNRVTVIEEAGQNKCGQIKWRCICECGKEFVTVGSYLLNGDTQSCGCLSRENFIKRSSKHGLWKHPLFGIWQNIYTRCYNKNISAYKDYGGRGIIMCEEWKNDFKIFYDWAIKNGWQKGLEIDKDIRSKELGMEISIYSPETCQFVTSKINSRNRRNNTLVTLGNKTASIAEFTEEYGLKRYTISQRLKLGWSVKEAIFGK